IFLDFTPTAGGEHQPDDAYLPTRDQVEQTLIEQALQPFLEEIRVQREKDTATISQHMEISLNELIHRQNLRMAELLEQTQADPSNPLHAANIKQVEDRLDELNGRLERRREELAQERNCTISDIRHHGRAWVLPHPERTSPAMAPLVKDDEVEKAAIQA